MEYYSAEKMCEDYFYNYNNHPYPKIFPSFKRKNLKYFENILNLFLGRKEFEPKKFIWAVMQEGTQYPAQLAKESNWKLYLRYKDFYKENKTDEKTIVKNYKNKEILTILKSIKNGEDFFGSKRPVNVFCSDILSNQFKADNPPCDLLLLFFSKSYNKWYFEQYPESTDLFIIDAKKMVEKYPKVIEKIKKYLGDDYFSSEESI